MDTGPYLLRIEKKPEHLVNGVAFNRQQSDAILSNNITFSEVMSFRNIEQRRVAIQYIGMNSLLMKSDFKLIDESKRGNRLYVSDGIYFSNPYRAHSLFFLSYICPSTRRPYVSAVDAEEVLDRFDAPNYISVRAALIALAHGRRRLPNLHGVLADSAMAWKLSLTLDEYRSMTAES